MFVRSVDAGGRRDILDNRPIHCGSFVELRDGSTWKVCRYEMNGPDGYLVLPDGTTIDIRPDDDLRWPWC
jgi:hypothetical protein